MVLFLGLLFTILLSLSGVLTLIFHGGFTFFFQTVNIIIFGGLFAGTLRCYFLGRLMRMDRDHREGTYMAYALEPFPASELSLLSPSLGGSSFVSPR